MTIRILLVGSRSDREKLRARTTGAFEIAGEFDSLGAARAADVDADAIVLAAVHAPPLDAAEDPAVDDPLTPREIEVLELLAQGLPNKAIAARLAISDQTVKFHVASISGKLGAANRTDAVRRAVRRGLVAL
jgi:DNA-binding NarL/FixJ family response regulator